MQPKFYCITYMAKGVAYSDTLSLPEMVIAEIPAKAVTHIHEIRPNGPALLSPEQQRALLASVQKLHFASPPSPPALPVGKHL
jgi:hypothetical protein